MFPRDVVRLVVVVVVTLLMCRGGQGQVLKRATACFGNTNNYLHLDCEPGNVIHVLRVVHAAKLKTSGCISPFSVDTYRRECCGIQLSDCSINVQDGSSIQCENTTRCDAMATWSNTNKECDQDVYPPNTNYMRMEYMCIQINGHGHTTNNATKTDTTLAAPIVTTPPLITPSTSSSSTTFTTSTTTTTTPPITTTPPTTSTTSTKTVVIANITLTSTIPGRTSAEAQAGSNNGSHKEECVSEVTVKCNSCNESPATVSDAMIGAIVGGCLGMLLTFVVFVFYWGRKRRLRIVGKPQPSVWDYLLSQTFTVRGTKGYDHFPSVRSSASSDGDPNSPVVRKNIWLPNIIDNDDKYEDVISNYDNDTDRYHRVEIHHNASPSAYAILNLHANNLYQDTNHEV